MTSDFRCINCGKKDARTLMGGLICTKCKGGDDDDRE